MYDAVRLGDHRLRARREDVDRIAVPDVDAEQLHPPRFEAAHPASKVAGAACEDEFHRLTDAASRLEGLCLWRAGPLHENPRGNHGCEPVEGDGHSRGNGDSNCPPSWN
jgi:hypothetical protein